MKKEEKETSIHPKMKVTLADPKEMAEQRLVEKKRADKLNSMKIAMTYIEIQRMRKVTPEEAIEIADKFLKWLEEEEGEE